MRKTNKDAKRALISVRSTGEYKNRISKVAKLRGLDISDYVREAVDKALERDAMLIGARHGL